MLIIRPRVDASIGPCNIGAEKIFSKTPKGRRRGCLAAA